MMKKRFTFTTLLLLAFFAMSSINAQTILEEGFEADSTLPTGWISIDSDGDGWEWQFVTESSVAHTGTGYAHSHSYDQVGAPLYPNNYLITPEIDLSAYTGDLQLSWWVEPSANTPIYREEHYKIAISTNGTDTTNFTDVVFEETLLQEHEDWELRTVDLSSYAGETINIAFVHYDCYDEDRLKIDDILLEHASSISENDNNHAGLQIFPNPAKDYIIIGEKYDNITIANVTGQIVYQSDKKESINIANFPNGMYFISIENKGQIITGKFMKK